MLKATKIFVSISIFAILLFGIYVIAPAAEITEVELDNGLKILTIEDHSVPLAAVRVCYHVGIKNECPGVTGITSMCEMIMQEGTKKFKKGELSKIVQAGGGVSSSYTDWDVTHFYTKIPLDMLDTVLLLEADRMANVFITPEKLLLAKDIVRKRRLEAVESSLYGYINEEFINLAYGAHPYGHNIYGWPGDIDRINQDDVKEHLKKYFQPANALLIIAGAINPDSAIARAGELFGNINSIPLTDRRPISDPVQIGERRSTIEGDVGIPVVLIGYHIPPVTHPDNPALRLISNILSTGVSSRIYQRMVNDEKSGLYSAGGLIEPEGPGLIYSYTIFNYDSPIDVGEEHMLGEIDRLTNEYVSEAELERARNRAVVDFYKGSRTLDFRTAVVGTYGLITGDAHFTKKRVKALYSITPDDIKKTARKYLHKSNRIIVSISPPVVDESVEPGGDYE